MFGPGPGFSTFIPVRLTVGVHASRSAGWAHFLSAMANPWSDACRKEIADAVTADGGIASLVMGAPACSPVGMVRREHMVILDTSGVQMAPFVDRTGGTASASAAGKAR